MKLRALLLGLLPLAAPAAAQVDTGSPGMVPIMSTALETSHVLAAHPANLYGLQVATGSVSGCVMLFNSITAPAAGTVAPYLAPITVAANTTTYVDFSNGHLPVWFPTGISVVFSSTCGLTYTASATALFSATVH